ncbi:DUF6538 domain-containing protein [uncultured Ruegeria sp.]|uniref:DUF6538 domain-containing protein n=1 Tax=uncultured Ruegeria sp. TaxID=259304 RepID=UPI002622DA39|nr:DUF6538 domain-containing protein [uncultured Ruegeria sp.]
MGIVNDRGRYYWVKRVPKRFKGLVRGQDGQPVTQVRQALHTDSKAEALAKAAQIEVARMAEWEALAAGDNGSARAHYESAKKLAGVRGFQYRALNTLLSSPIEEIVGRLHSLGTSDKLETPEVVRAVLGAVPVTHPDLNGVLKEYIDLTKTRHLSKSDAQKRRWKLSKERAVRNFVSAVFPSHSPPIDQITRSDALKFRNWWSERIEVDGLAAQTANKDFGHLAEIWGTWCELTATHLENPFSKLALDGAKEVQRPSFSREWVQDRLLAKGAFEGLNSEAADILLVMINTGLRPSEVTDAPLEDFCTQENIPFIRIAPNGRELKVAHTRREIPLLGVSCLTSAPTGQIWGLSNGGFLVHRSR